MLWYNKLELPSKLIVKDINKKRNRMEWFNWQKERIKLIKTI
jgi:hypothetical protein